MKRNAGKEANALICLVKKLLERNFTARARFNQAAKDRQTALENGKLQKQQNLGGKTGIGRHYQAAKTDRTGGKEENSRKSNWKTGLERADL